MRFARFTLFICLMTGFGTGATPLWAQSSSIMKTSPNWEVTDLTQTSKNKLPVRMQMGKNAAALTAGDGFLLDTVTHGLGSISALAMDADGTLYAVDREVGQVWRLRDRNQDGKFDTKQALPQRYDEPSGLAVFDNKVFVADRNAVWVMTGIEPPVKLAGLLNSGSKRVHHPLSISTDGQTLYLGLSTLKGEAELLSLNVESGKAELIQKITSDQDITDLAAFGNGAPWLALEHGVGSSLDTLVELSPSQSLAALVLPLTNASGTASNSAQQNWPEGLANHVLVSRQSSDGYDVLALPAGLGRIDGQGKVIFSGFLSSSGRSAWGLPGPLLLNEHGLLVADSKNGDLYRLSGMPVPIVSQETDKTDSLASSDAPSTKPTTLATPPEMQVSTITQGSQIGSVSTLTRGSTLDVGSTIIRDFKPLSLDKDDGENESEVKDTRDNKKRQQK